MTDILDLGQDIVTPVTGVMTKNILDKDLADGKFSRLSSFVSEGISHDQLVAELAKTVEIFDFWGGAEGLVAVLDEEVPEGFPNRLKVKMITETYEEDVCEFDEETQEEVCEEVEKTREVPDLDKDGEPIMIPKLFKEYCYNYRISLDKKNVLFKVGFTNSNGCLTHKVSDLELRAWVNKFTVANITVWKDYKTLAASSKYCPAEE